MPFIRCIDCSDFVSTSARACPRCGRPVPVVEAPAPPAYASSGIPAAPQSALQAYAPAAARETAAAAWAPPPPEEVECPLCRLRMQDRSYCYRCETRLVPAGYLPPHHFPRVPVDYAGFGPRLGALFLDGLVLLPVTGLAFWIETRSPAGMVLGAVIALVLYEAYHVGLIATFGQTLGKRLMDIQVRRADGARVGWGGAFVRRLPLLLGEVAGVIVAVFVAGMLTQAQFDEGGGIVDRMQMLMRASSTLNLFFQLPFTLYNLANILTFFANVRHRALHDFMAGTVVVYE